jgi:2-aminoethylphosphonate-pyruvate transaminase
MRSILLNPGPVSLSEGVRRAATATDLCHREPEFFDLQDRVRSKLANVYSLDAHQWTAVLLGGSGTTALEAMLISLVPRSGKLLILENGVYGERLSRLAEIYGIACEKIQHGWTGPWDLDRVKTVLADNSFTHVAAVHHETTTGRLNPVAELARICQESESDLLLDTVSSFAAEAIPFDLPSLAACAVTANKCLHGIPGLCFVMVRQDRLDKAVNPPRSLTLDMKLWADHQSRQSTPFTPSVNAMLALDVALDEMERSGGWEARHARYVRLAGRVGNHLGSLGVESLLPASDTSCVLRAYRLGESRTYDTVHDALKQRGFIVYAGQGSMISEMFRVSTMGDISNYDMERLLAALQAVFT